MADYPANQDRQEIHQHVHIHQPPSQPPLQFSGKGRLKTETRDQQWENEFLILFVGLPLILVLLFMSFMAAFWVADYVPVLGIPTFLVVLFSPLILWFGGLAWLGNIADRQAARRVSNPEQHSQGLALR